MKKHLSASAHVDGHDPILTEIYNPKPKK